MKREGERKGKGDPMEGDTGNERSSPRGKEGGDSTLTQHISSLLSFISSILVILDEGYCWEARKRKETLVASCLALFQAQSVFLSPVSAPNAKHPASKILLKERNNLSMFRFIFHEGQSEGQPAFATNKFTIINKIDMNN